MRGLEGGEYPKHIEGLGGYKPGDYVCHPEYGVGRIIDVRKEIVLGKEEVVGVVEFDDGSTRTLVLSWGVLQKVSGEELDELRGKIDEERRKKKAEESRELTGELGRRVEQFLSEDDLKTLDSLDPEKFSAFLEVSEQYIKTFLFAEEGEYSYAIGESERLRYIIPELLKYATSHSVDDFRRFSGEFLEIVEPDDLDNIFFIRDTFGDEFGDFDIESILKFSRYIYHPLLGSTLLCGHYFSEDTEKFFFSVVEEKEITPDMERIIKISLRFSREKLYEEFPKFLEYIDRQIYEGYRKDEIVGLLDLLPESVELINCLISYAGSLTFEQMLFLMSFAKEVPYMDKELLEKLYKYVVKFWDIQQAIRLEGFIESLKSITSREQFGGVMDLINAILSNIDYQSSVGCVLSAFDCLSRTIKEKRYLHKEVMEFIIRGLEGHHKELYLVSLPFMLKATSQEELKIYERLIDEGIFPFPDWVKEFSPLNDDKRGEWIQKKIRKVNEFFSGSCPQLKDNENMQLFYNFLIKYCSSRRLITYDYFMENLKQLLETANIETLRLLVEGLLGNVPEEFRGLEESELLKKAMEIKGKFRDLPHVVGREIEYDYTSVNAELITQIADEVVKNYHSFVSLRFLDGLEGIAEQKEELKEAIDEYKRRIVLNLIAYLTIRDERRRREFAEAAGKDPERLARLKITRAKDLKLVVAEIAKIEGKGARSTQDLIDELKTLEDKKLLFEALGVVLTIEFQRSKTRDSSIPEGVQKYLTEWLTELIECYGLSDPGLLERVRSDEIYTKIDGLIYLYTLGGRFLKSLRERGVPVSQEIEGHLGGKSKQVLEEKGKISPIDRGERVITIVNNRFLAYFRGEIGNDCTTAIEHRLRILEPKENFYIVFVGNKARGYIGLFEGESNGEKFLIIDTIQIEDIPTDVLSVILNSLKELARENGYRGLLVPNENNIDKTFNYSVPKNFILNLEEFKKDGEVEIVFRPTLEISGLKYPESLGGPTTKYKVICQF